MKKMFIKKVKKMLEDQRKEMLEKAANATRIEIDIDGDECDVIQGKQLALANAQLVAREKEKFARIESALKRIADGEYGMCAQCSEDISEARLLINPTFHICVVCAEKNERLKRQHAH
jgi:DnaK suppressor protein